jgi:hypothetical protein
LASNHSEFITRSYEYDISYGGVVNTWTVDPITCNPTWDTTSVVYFLGDSTNKQKLTLVFTMNPQLSKIIKIDQYQPRSHTFYNAKW